MLAGLIKQWEKNMSRTMYKDVSIQQPTKDSTKPTLLDEPHENRRYWFARHCYDNKGITAPSGYLWEESFLKREGFALSDYIEFALNNKLKEKYNVQNKSR